MRRARYFSRNFILPRKGAVTEVLNLSRDSRSLTVRSLWKKFSALWLSKDSYCVPDPLKYSFSVCHSDCAMQAPASPSLGLGNSCVRASDPREAPCSCHGCGLCRGVQGSPVLELVWWGELLSLAPFIPSGRGIFLL